MVRHFIGYLLDQLTKTFDRRSRLFTIVFSCLALALSRCPRLVLFVLLLLPAKVGKRSVRLAIGNSLFQLDHPSEALTYLEQSSHSDRLSTDEYLLRAMCLFQGLGRFHDAVLLLARANEQNTQEAQRLGVADIHSRVLDGVWARHIGHTATLDYVVKLAILEGRRREDTILYVPPGGHVANRFLLGEMAAHLNLIEMPADLPFDASAVPALHFDYLGPRLPDQTTMYFWQLAGKTYKSWHEQRGEHLLTLAPEIEARGWAALHDAGLPQGAWFVALHVREGKWDMRKPGLHGILNAELATYLPAIVEVTRRGGWIIRIGDPDMSPLPQLMNVIDYCHSNLRADWMDIFIAARCRFMIGTASGPAFIPPLFGIASVLTNWWPPAQRPWHASDLFVPKMLRRMRAGNYLTLNETLCEPFSYCHSLRYLADRCGASVEDNDAEIIRATVEEMFDRLDGQTSEDAKTAELHVRAGRIYQSHNVFGMARLAREFLRRHSGLIE
jgi:putative glycosyltransferase (TIGR04372 family)